MGRIPVFLTRLAAPTLVWDGTPDPPVETFQAGARFDLGDFSVQSFTIPHDSIDPVGFTLTAAGVKVAIATDLGYLPESVKYHLQDSHLSTT